MRTLLAYLLLTTALVAQVTVTTPTVIETEPQPRIGNLLIVKDDFQATPFKVGHIQIKTEVPWDKISVDISNLKRETVPFSTIQTDKSPYEIVVLGAGQYWYYFSGVDVDFEAKRFLVLNERGSFTIPGTKPGPEPIPDPDPLPSVVPIPGPGLKVLIVYELDDIAKYSSGHRFQIQSTMFLADLMRTVDKDLANQPLVRVLDKDTMCPPNRTSIWCTALARTRTTLPWIIISTDKSGFEGPLPATDAETKALVARFK